MRGRKMSSANFVWPVHFARASTLRKGFPTTFKGFSLFSLLLINQVSDKKAQKTQKRISSNHPDTRHGCPLPSLVPLCLFVAISLIRGHKHSRAEVPSLRRAGGPPLIPPLHKS